MGLGARRGGRVEAHLALLKAATTNYLWWLHYSASDDPAEQALALELERAGNTKPPFALQMYADMQVTGALPEAGGILDQPWLLWQELGAVREAVNKFQLTVRRNQELKSASLGSQGETQ